MQNWKRALSAALAALLLFLSAPVVSFSASEDADPETPLLLMCETDALRAEVLLSPDSRFAVGETLLSPDQVELTAGGGEIPADPELERDGLLCAVALEFRDPDGGQAIPVAGSAELCLTLRQADESAALLDAALYRCEPEGAWCPVEDYALDETAHSFRCAAELPGTYAVCYLLGCETEAPVFDLPEEEEELPAPEPTAPRQPEEEVPVFVVIHGARMLLSELLSQLRRSEDAGDVEAIVCTDGSILRFTRDADGGDWLLESGDTPFSDPESLALLFADGSRMDIGLLSSGRSVGASANLGEFLVNWKLAVGDTVYSDDTVDENTVIEYKPGMQYSLELYFAESPELQFDTPDEGEPPRMYFRLPDAFVVPDGYRMTLNVDLGRKGVLADNIVSVETGDDGHKYLMLDWNWEDKTHWDAFRNSSQATLKLIVNGVFAETDPQVLSINNKDVTIRKEDLHNAIVNKSGNYDPSTQIIDYTVTVSSQGSTSDITLTDTLGSALIYRTEDPEDEQHYGGGIVYDAEASTWTAEGRPEEPSITKKTGNTFRVIIPAMADGDCLVFHYSAKVDVDRIAVSGSPSFDETGNTARIFGDSNPVDNAAMYHETNIVFADLEKNCVGKRFYSQGGMPHYTVSWLIETNKQVNYPLADTTVTDTISPAVQNISKYSGDGLTVRCYTGGTLAETRQLSWEELGIDPETDKSWTYHIPDTDPIYRYELSYDTDVNMDGQEETVVVENSATGKGGIDSDRAVLPPPGAPGFDIKKQATDVSSTGVTWEITLTVAGTALDFPRIVLTEHSGALNNNTTYPWGNNTDYLPSKWMQKPSAASGIRYKEKLRKVEVIGLEEEETFLVHYGTYNTNAPNSDQWNGSLNLFPGAGGTEILVSGDSKVLKADFAGIAKTANGYPDHFELEFYKDQARTAGGLIKPEGDTPTRT
ncbi:MAG: hypothetical protein IKS66_06370, partial [Oscillospiraceae bacterium]|nr:hypothetical protein [Oscillospiraceae bacterium]